ncbi:MAG: hypothetical protein ACXWT0_00390 [Methylobacter sp.]
MIEYESIYQVLTPAGVFQSVFGEEDTPVEYRGDEAAIQFFKNWLALNQISGEHGIMLSESNLEPDELYGFCQPDGSGITVIPPFDDLLMYEQQEAIEQAEETNKPALDGATQEELPMHTEILDAVSGVEKLKMVKEITIIRNGISALTGMGKVEAIKRIKEIRVALGVKSADSPDQEWMKVGRVELYKSTDKFVAIENGTNKNIGADGGLVSSYAPTLYDTKEDAENSVKKRYERNKLYEAENTPEKQAERKEQRELEKQQRQQALDLAIEEALKIIPAYGYSLARHGNSIQVIGKFNEELHSRLKRAGAMWDSEPKSWFIHSDKANTGLQKAFKNFESAIVKKADQQAETERLELEAEKQAAIDKKTKEDDERKKQPTIEQGEYGDFYVSPVPSGYRVSFDYDQDNVDKIKSLSYRSYNPDTKKWFVDALSATELRKILDKSVIDAAIKTEESRAKIEQDRALAALQDAERKRQIDEEQSNGIISISKFYSPYQAVPEIGYVIAHKGDKFVIIQVDAHQLTKKELDWEEDAGQPGLDYGTLRVTIKAQRIDNESETENKPVPVSGNSDETITPSGEEPSEVDNPAEEQTEENKTVEDLDLPVNHPTESQENQLKAAFEVELNALKQVTDIYVFDERLDDIAGRIEEAGLMDEMDVQLNEVADILTELLALAEKG